MNHVAKSPRLRLAITLLLTIVIGVLSSILATQIMPQGVLNWALLPRVSSFWMLILFSAFWLYIHVVFLNYDESVMRYADDQHCIAIIRKAKLDGIASFIRENPEQASLVDAKTFLDNLGVK